MKISRAFLVCSLLGTLWLASCSSSTKKPTPPPGDAGAAGETAAAGATGEPTTQAGAGGDAGAPSAAGAAGELVSLGGQAGEGGAPPECFNQLDSAQSTSEAGAAGNGPIASSYKCPALLDSLSPVFDPANGTLKLDGTLLGPAVHGVYTVFYKQLVGESQQVGCFDDLVQSLGTQLTLPITVDANAYAIEVTAFSVVDQCGNEAALSTTGSDGCVNLHLTPNDDDTWSVTCGSGTCHTTTCAEYMAE